MAVCFHSLSGVVTAENALKSGQTTCRIIFWHPAVYLLEGGLQGHLLCGLRSVSAKLGK